MEQSPFQSGRKERPYLQASLSEEHLGLSSDLSVEKTQRDSYLQCFLPGTSSPGFQSSRKSIGTFLGFVFDCSHYVAQAGLQVLGSSSALVSASPIAGTVGLHIHSPLMVSIRPPTQHARLSPSSEVPKQVPPHQVLTTPATLGPLAFSLFFQPKS